jgi:hypothetical protein
LSHLPPTSNIKTRFHKTYNRDILSNVILAHSPFFFVSFPPFSMASRYFVNCLKFYCFLFKKRFHSSISLKRGPASFKYSKNYFTGRSEVNKIIQIQTYSHLLTPKIKCILHTCEIFQDGFRMWPATCFGVIRPGLDHAVRRNFQLIISVSYRTA